MSPECGGELHGDAGQLTSPGYPARYDADLTCTWVITGPRSITLRVWNFSLGMSDTVEVWDGGSDQSPSLGNFKFWSIPTLIGPSSGHQLTVRFVSGAYSFAGNGFDFTWAETRTYELASWKRRKDQGKQELHGFRVSCVRSARYPADMLIGIQDFSQVENHVFSGLDSLKCGRMEQYPQLQLTLTDRISVPTSSNSAENLCPVGEVVVELYSSFSAFSDLTKFRCATVQGGPFVDEDHCRYVTIDNKFSFSTNRSASSRWPVECKDDEVVTGISYMAGHVPPFEAIRCCVLTMG
ncbi:neuropilin-1-like [Pollicipes pollicipes]|uniref:neuropilin-1-like n=1 Tax=Pollicipes pollicipes TaxID=41117 RepID=UPI001884C516|nr:neuropilin-1-like [Pollicipes pollicipes]XP_037071023.1 neuropilin-1-like [Pollicipes pollicipes]